MTSSYEHIVQFVCPATVAPRLFIANPAPVSERNWESVLVHPKGSVQRPGPGRILTTNIIRFRDCSCQEKLASLGIDSVAQMC